MENKKLVKIEPEYVYLTIPAKYVCVYHKLLVYMADMGETLVNDCHAICKGDGKNIMNCWNMFQSALAAYALGKIKEADFLIKYITCQLEHIYNGSDKEPFNKSAYFPITEDGKLQALVTCNNNVATFEVDTETGQMYQTTLDKNNEFSIENNDLIVDEK